MKKGLLITSITSIVTVAAGLAFVANAKGIRFEAAKAQDKSFTFDATVGSEQFEDHFTAQKPAEISVVTGVGSNLETSVSLKKDETNDFGKSFGDNGRFVRNSETISSTDFTVEIGVNNLTNIEVVYGCVKETYTVCTELHCYVDVKDEDGDWHTDISGSSTSSAFNTDLNASWTKSTEEYSVKEVRVRVGVSGGSVYWGEPLYIKSIALNWSC